ncbi:MAG: M16 family metallopeptidase, partial [Aquabacterium sp.]
MSAQGRSQALIPEPVKGEGIPVSGRAGGVAAGAAGVHLHTLANGVRLLAMPMAGRYTAALSVYVRAGSVHDARGLGGIAHVVEHMLFKGTRRRDALGINREAERLGGEINAHTDKDHLALYLRARPQDTAPQLQLLAELVAEPTFPADELERERGVLLNEHAEVDDDAMAAAWTLADRAAWGLHPMVAPVIGTRRVIESLRQADLAAHARRLFTGSNVVVAAAGAVDVDAFLRDAEAGFGALPAGLPSVVAPPNWAGGIRSRLLSAGGQAHAVLALAGPSRADADPQAELAAAVLGEGMSSPLLRCLREERGLVYHADCAVDRFEPAGQLAIEWSCGAADLDACLAEVAQLLRGQADRVHADDLDRARHQIGLRLLRQRERAGRRIEAAALALRAGGALPDEAAAAAALAQATTTSVRDH